MCSALMCLSNFTTMSCSGWPSGAMEGTTCGSGQVIITIFNSNITVKNYVLMDGFRFV